MAKNFKKLLEEGFENIAQHFYDEEVEENAEFRASSGIKAIIKRTMVGETCPWCEEMEGIYEYGKHPKDVFRRHRNCDCVVEYITKKERTNVWTKIKEKNNKYKRIEYNRSNKIIFQSKKAKEILKNQPKVSEEDYNKVADELTKMGVQVLRGEEYNGYIEGRNAEALVMDTADGKIIFFHTELSYSGMYEEYIHINQAKEGKIASLGTKLNAQLEIEAKEELIKNAEKYNISLYEIEVLKEEIEDYKMKIEKLNNE